MHPTVVNLRKKKKITLAKWARNNGFNPQHCSMVIAGKRGVSEFGVAGEIIEALKNIGVWVETKKGKE
jgi:hypothetical protein